MTGFRMFFNQKPPGSEQPQAQAQQPKPQPSPGMQQPVRPAPVQQPAQTAPEASPVPAESARPMANPGMGSPSMQQNPGMQQPSLPPMTSAPSAPSAPSMPNPSFQQSSPPAMSRPQQMVETSIHQPAPFVPTAPPVGTPVLRSNHQQDERNPMEGMERKDMSSILEKMGVSTARIKYANDRIKLTGETLAEVMRDFGFLNAERVAEAMALNAGIDYFPPAKIEQINGQSLQPLKPEMPPSFENFAPIMFNGNEVVVAVSEPSQTAHAVNYFHRYRTRAIIASDNTVLSIYRRFFSSTEETIDELLRKFKEIMDSRNEDLEKQPGLMRDIIGNILRHACQMKVSDLHLHMTEKVGLIKMTIDGESSIFRAIPKDLYDRILQKLVTDARVKAEDLRGGMREALVEFSSDTDMKLYDDLFSRYGFRLQLGDAKGGYTAVIRILDRSSNAAELKSLRFDAKAQETMKRYINTPTGLILVTGPTGSGKTTSLYAMLKEIDPVKRSIQTIENPVEYRHGLWMQYELSRTAKVEGEEWGKFLKGLLRNAPKVILMGEVRDADTARTLLDAANTGHLVFTTLHTNNAPSAISRLRKLDVDMDALAGELLGVLAQRLVRTLCHHCRVPDNRESTLELIEPTRNPFLKNFPRSPFMATEEGCPHCHYTGYSGRRIIYELLDVTPTVRKLIEANSPTSQIAQHGIRAGFSMWECGLKLVTVGETSIEALRMVAQPENYSEE